MHAFTELFHAREKSETEAAEQKSVQMSFYAPQIYQFKTVGVFGTMFGTPRGKHAILVFRPRSAEEIRMAEWREAFWPTTKVGRAALNIESKRLKAKEDSEKTTRWRVKTWPTRIGRRMGRHIQHLLQHGSLAEKAVSETYSPFWKLEGRPESWERRVPEVIGEVESGEANADATKSGRTEASEVHAAEETSGEVFGGRCS